MKSNKGITLISLIVYIIVFTIVIATVTTISGYFIKNTDEVAISSKLSDQYIRLTTYLTEDINSINFKEMEQTIDNSISITFLDESTHKYLYNENKIYYISEQEGKKITLCDNIEECKISYDTENKKLTVEITSKDTTYKNIYTIS